MGEAFTEAETAIAEKVFAAVPSECFTVCDADVGPGSVAEKKCRKLNEKSTSACDGLKQGKCKKAGIFETGGRCVWWRSKCIELEPAVCSDFKKKKTCKKAKKTDGVKCSWSKKKGVCKDAKRKSSP